ncbi:DUF6421 family protein [Patulibacter sp.]|uniref:DUF6421 family protein n=1 Tax=Patulibacter sp. TaxID=1912859 RepID=UPI0027259DCB|nr:DUF6421 family protein [Patulibacter sp.]MDO9410294.1 DUF6421 family protein [Patulibacter sp.]
MPTRRPLARVLFDEAHREAWTIRPDVAREMQPAHPEDSSYARAADRLRRWDLDVRAHATGRLTPEVLADVDVLVVAHPSEPRWERTVPGEGPLFTADELAAIHAFVAGGGGLLVLAEEEHDKYGNNLTELLAPYGVAVRHEVLSDYVRHDRAPHWVLAAPARGAQGRIDGVDLLAGVEGVCFYRGATLELSGDARALLRTASTASTPDAPLAAVVAAGAGRVAVLGDSDLFGDDCLDDRDHETLLRNLVSWLAVPSMADEGDAPLSAAHDDPAWARLVEAVEALRLLQRPDGALDRADDPAVASHAEAHVGAMVEAVAALAPHLPHQDAYLQAVRADLERWAATGFGVPDFGPSLEAFRPDLDRRDGAEHLVLFPMYKQNGSRDTAFEALLIRVPWPEWLAHLERERYDNEKFVPVTFVDHTSGYDSECAVLFPETVSVAERAANHFGGIFCDREAERFRRTVTAAAGILRLDLPPDVAALCASQRAAQDAYLLWDLVHDRAHSHGDLPFDPFMIRQRMPFWMYALEELRCDLTAFGEAVLLEEQGVAVARDTQRAILLDRLFRFPVTGTRVRNYDGLGGQLLFAYLHRTGRVHWTDNRLAIEWDTVAEGVLELRTLVEDLYRQGIDRTKLGHWRAAHQLVATYVPPASGSVWATQPLAEVEDPRVHVDEVLDDEFPLSIFYTSLRLKMAPALERPARPASIAA